LHWEIYDLLGYGGLTPEIVEYLIALLTTPPILNNEGAREGEFRPMQLFQRLEDFYLRWCEGEFIDTAEEPLPQKKRRQLQKQGIQLGQRQVDVYAGLNVMILLLELHRYALSRDDLKDKIAFYPCGQKDTEGFDETRLLRIIGYSDCISIKGFLKTVQQFLSGAGLSGADLSGAGLSGADLSSTNLSSTNLRGANFSDANFSDANLSCADLSDANLRGAYLSDTKLSEAKLSNANLRGADLSGSDLSGSDLRDADFRGADFSGSDIRDADLKGANLRGANLRGANLRGADLRDAYLMDAYLTRTNLKGADLRGAWLGNVLWDEETKWEDVRGLETAANVPDTLKQKFGLG
jgi:uncharacterized protein YjbI with pentapeptide repeats